MRAVTTPLLGCAFALGGCPDIDQAPDIDESSATAHSVPAPDYALDVTGLDLLTDVDDVVQSAMGGADLAAGSVIGQSDDAYLAGASAAVGASVPARAFALVGEGLTFSLVRTLIIANSSSDVRTRPSSSRFMPPCSRR